MIICAAVDDHLGMTFNNRRQSKDSILRQHLLEVTNGSKLWINTYTAKQFEIPLSENIVVDDAFLDKAGEHDFCFVENISVAEYKEQINKIFLFKWNRLYPSDTYFDIDLSVGGWRLRSVLEFEGSSHKKITKEEWMRE